MSILLLDSIHHAGWMNNMIWRCNIKKYLISIHYTYHAFLRNIQIVHDRYFTSKASSSEIPRQKYIEKHQHEERYKPRKCHIYIEMIRKFKFQMAHNPWNISHFEKKKCFGRETVLPWIKTSIQYHKKLKTEKVIWTWKDDWPPQRTSTYKRPFTHEGNYLVLIVLDCVISVTILTLGPLAIVIGILIVISLTLILSLLWGILWGILSPFSSGH